MTVVFDKHNPFVAHIKERYALSQSRDLKQTHHIVLDLKGSNLSYQAGDSVGIYPMHDPEIVDKTLSALRLTGEESVTHKETQEVFSLGEYLTIKANLTQVSPKLLRYVAENQTCLEKKQLLNHLLLEEHREALKAYLQQFEVWDFLLEHQEVPLTAQLLVDLLMPLLPRFYSISSSQKCVGDEVHLTVAHVEYDINGKRRKGACTHFLCHMAEPFEKIVPLFIQPSHGFSPPEDIHAPLIMIGPGTGVAPFRAFLQERILHAGSQGRHWLFFGEKTKKDHFFYESDWQLLRQKGHLKLELAFSRDQENKIYVQDKIREKGQELFEWIQEGAYLYVCGNADKMAKDVEKALLEIFQTCGKKEASEARDYLKELRKQKRYLRDVY